MVNIEYESIYENAPYSVFFDVERYSNALTEMGVPSDKVDSLHIEFKRHSFLSDGVTNSITRKITIPTDLAWADSDAMDHRVDFRLFHETKHALDMQIPGARLFRFVYWTLTPQIIFVGAKSGLDHVSPENPFTSTLSAVITMSSLLPMYKFDPFEIRANKFAKKIITNPSNKKIIYLTPKQE